MEEVGWLVGWHKCWKKKKHGLPCVAVTTEKTRGLLKSLWLFGEKEEEVEVQKLFNAAWLDRPTKGARALLLHYTSSPICTRYKKKSKSSSFSSSSSMWNFMYIYTYSRDGIIENLTHSLYIPPRHYSRSFGFQFKYLIVWHFLFSFSFYRHLL